MGIEKSTILYFCEVAQVFRKYPNLNCEGGEIPVSKSHAERFCSDQKIDSMSFYDWLLISDVICHYSSIDLVLAILIADRSYRVGLKI
jgi:hypothetical protein